MRRVEHADAGAYEPPKFDGQGNGDQQHDKLHALLLGVFGEAVELVEEKQLLACGHGCVECLRTPPVGAHELASGPVPENPFLNIPLPAGATFVADWCDTDSANPGRYFAGNSWRIGRLDVAVDGTQFADGTEVRHVVLDDIALTVDQARQLARALMAAADEVEANALT